MGDCRVYIAAAAVAFAAFAPGSSAQFIPPGGGGGGGGQTTIAVEYIQRQNVEERLTAHDVGLLGDGVDLNTGAVSFAHTDVVLPGNNGLEVAVRRARAQSFPFPHLDVLTFGGAISNDFADWSLETPRLEIALIAAGYTAFSQGPNMCAVVPQPGTFYTFPGDSPSLYDPFFEGEQISNGLRLSVPGGGGGVVLQAPAGVTWPSGTVRVTKDYWTFACGPADGAAGGVVATAPNGDVYHFDLFDWAPHSAIPVTQGGRAGAIARVNAVLLATEVIDVNGAWVRYDYDSSNRLSRIHASDGREITVSRRPDGLIGSITAHGRTWSYGYTSHSGNLHLSTVTLPDGRSWSLNFSRFGYGANAAFDCSASDFTVSLTHPDGISGSFTFRETRHLKGDIINDGPSPSCVNPANPMDQPFYDHMSLISRTLSGQGYPSSTWTYAYSGHVDGTPPPALKWGQVTAPDGVRTREFFHARTSLEGLMQRREVYAGPTLLSTETLSYAVEPALGVTMVINETQAKHANPRPVTQRVVTQGGETYTTQLAYNATQSAATYSFGRPTQVTRSSTVQAGSRTTQTTYVNRTARWIVALPATVRENGVLARSNTYDSLGRLVREDRFGALHATYGYHSGAGQRGALAWVRDALNRQVNLASWRRGVPRSVTRPDGVVLSRAVNDFGQLTSQSDARGTVFTYGYDQAGRLTLVNRPTGFADTTLSYTGLGAGLTQTITHGALRTIISYDAMLRPMREERRAVLSGGGSIFTRFGYDALNRTVFQSFPSASAGAPDGAVTTYDGLGRVTRTEETVAPFAATVTAYLSDNRVRVIDPAGAVTTTWRSGWRSPDDGDTVRIDHPLGLSTRMSYDALGNLLTARQFGSHSGFSVDETQTWAYDSRQRLCRHATPQSGHTLYAYDAANQMTGVARGAAAGTGCAGLPSSLRVTTSYDLLGRVEAVNFPGADPDIDLTHDANGNLTGAARGNAVWSYSYDTLDQLTGEALSLDGRVYTNSYAYTADGRLNTRTTPGGRTISFAPDGHGRPKRARIGAVNHAGSAVYHPSGQLAAASYSNGLSYTASFDARQLMTSLRVDAGSTARLRYSYGRDALGRVTALTDHVRPGQNRSFGYDGLGRLTSAAGPWGAGSFSYDLLNNIRSRTLGARTVTLQYDAAGRLARYRDSAAGGAWRNQAYDARGNTTSDGLHGFVYDRSERPVSISGAASGSFVYDAHGRRVKQVLAGETVYTVYGLDGTLLYRDNASTGEETDYIAMGSHTVGRFDAAGAFTFIHSDHLGSASAATNASGAVAWRESYTPFGELLDDPSANRNQPGFTGHVRDAATSLTYAQARYYNPVTARFLSPDPVGFASGGPGYFNRYAYVANDPVNATDPTGMCFQQSRAVSASNPGCRITGRSGARSDSRHNADLRQISSSAGLVAHSLWGGGAAAQFDISRHPRAILQAESRIMRSASGGDAGSFSRAIAAAIATGDAQAIDTTLGGLQTGVVGVGQATFTLQGTLTVDGDEWRFVGQITGTSEQFDFNEKPLGERAPGAEAATRAGSAMGASEYGVDYLGTFNVEAAGVTCTGSRIQRTEC